MNNKLYTVYDRVAQESGPIFEAKNDLIAWRMVLRANLPISPSDYHLMCVGIYCHDPVSLTAFDVPLIVNSVNKDVEEVVI